MAMAVAVGAGVGDEGRHGRSPSAWASGGRRRRPTCGPPRRRSRSKADRHRCLARRRGADGARVPRVLEPPGRHAVDGAHARRLLGRLPVPAGLRRRASVPGRQRLLYPQHHGEPFAGPLSCLRRVLRSEVPSAVWALYRRSRRHGGRPRRSRGAATRPALRRRRRSAPRSTGVGLVLPGRAGSRVHALPCVDPLAGHLRESRALDPVAGGSTLSDVLPHALAAQAAGDGRNAGRGACRDAGLSVPRAVRSARLRSPRDVGCASRLCASTGALGGTSCLAGRRRVDHDRPRPLVRVGARSGRRRGSGRQGASAAVPYQPMAGCHRPGRRPGVPVEPGGLALHGPSLGRGVLRAGEPDRGIGGIRAAAPPSPGRRAGLGRYL